MSYARIFETSVHGPSAAEAYEGDPIIEENQAWAIKDFTVDPYNPDSSIELDTAVEPPVLKLRSALASLAYGAYDPENREYVSFTFIDGDELHVVNGDYAGPGSRLELTKAQS